MLRSSFFWHHLQSAPHAAMVRVVLQLSLSSLGITLETHCGGPYSAPIHVPLHARAEVLDSSMETLFDQSFMSASASRFHPKTWARRPEQRTSTLTLERMRRNVPIQSNPGSGRSWNEDHPSLIHARGTSRKIKSRPRHVDPSIPIDGSPHACR